MATTTMGPQHDFRASFQERIEDAVDFLEEELPEASIELDNPSFIMTGLHQEPHYMIVIEDCGRSRELIDGLADSMYDIVAKVRGVDHYEHGAEIYVLA